MSNMLFICVICSEPSVYTVNAKMCLHRARCYEINRFTPPRRAPGHPPAHLHRALPHAGARDRGQPLHSFRFAPLLKLIDSIRLSEGGDDAVGNTHLAQISRFQLFELILLSKLDKQFPVERFQAAVSQSTVPSPPLNVETSVSLNSIRLSLSLSIYIYIYIYVQYCCDYVCFIVIQCYVILMISLCYIICQQVPTFLPDDEWLARSRLLRKTSMYIYIYIYIHLFIYLFI